MFRDAIDSFRSKTRDKLLRIDEDAESDTGYQVCCEFLDEYAHEDSDDIHALVDYVTYGEFGEGVINKRLIDILASMCRQYDNAFCSHISNQSYCNSLMSAIERAENHFY